MATAATETGFFSLPGEIRNRIYNNLIADQTASLHASRTTEDFSENLSQRFPREEHKAIPLGATGRISPPAFAQTCQSIRQEMLTMLYGSHIFVGPVAAVAKFLEPMDEQSKTMLRRVCITWPMATEKKDLAMACLTHVREKTGLVPKDGVLKFEITTRAEPERTIWVSEGDFEGVVPSASMLKALRKR